MPNARKDQRQQRDFPAAALRLEQPALVQAVWDTRSASIPKPVDITIDYLRTGRAVTSYASQLRRRFPGSKEYQELQKGRFE